MSDFSTIIRKVHSLSVEAIESVLPHITLQHLSRGKLLFSEGVVNDNFYIVRKGMLRFFHVDMGKDYTICFAGRGDVVASLHSYLHGMPSICNIESLSEVELYMITKADLERLFESSIELANWGRLIAYGELFTLERRYSFVGTGDAYSRYKAFMQMRPQEDIQQIPLKHIASYLGIAPQTLSRMRRIYARE